MASHLVRLLFHFPGPTHPSHLFLLKANIFGTEQDRVNCSFYYKVCGFLSVVGCAPKVTLLR
jgi:hypothetical protein